MLSMGHENHNFIELGDLTRAARDKLLKYSFQTPDDDDAVTIDDLQDAIDLDARSTFPEGVANQLQNLGVDCTVDDTVLLAKEVKTRYKQRIGELDESTWKTLKKWINGQKTSVVNRETNYNLCYALNMDIKETETFFIKYFHSGAFNYKNAIDSIYFYCIQNNRPYSTIKRMLEFSKSFDSTNTKQEETEQIGVQIMAINDDDEFLWFLSKHCYNREQQYKRAKAKIIQKIDLLTATITYDDYEKNSTKNAALTNLSREITGRVADVKKLGLGKLPDEFTKSLPTNKTFSDIKLGKDLTYDVLRKALVVLTLYDFYQPLDGDEPTINVLRERRMDFEMEINKELMNCGFMPLYERNLFDAIVLFCANSTAPITTFQKIIELEYEPTT